MKGKTLVRIGAALTALSMLGTVSAFAEPSFDVKYNATLNQLELTNIQGASDGDSTFLVYDLSAAAAALSTETAPPYADQEIYYVDQIKLKGTEANLKLAAGAAAADKYKVVLGMGGAGITTPKLEVVELRALPTYVTAYTGFKDAAGEAVVNTTFESGLLVGAELPDIKAAVIEQLPKKVTASTVQGTATGTADIEIVNWSVVGTYVPTEKVASITVKPELKADDPNNFPHEGETAPELPTITVTMIDTVTVTELNPNFAASKDDIAGNQEADDVIAALPKTIAITGSTPEVTGRELKINWTAPEDYDKTNYATAQNFIGTIVLEDEAYAYKYALGDGVSGTITLAVTLKDPTVRYKITALEEIPDKVVVRGSTTEADLRLPEKVTIKTLEGTEVAPNTTVNVGEWASAPAYDKDTNGTYVFTAELNLTGTTYTNEDDLKATINVVVSSKEIQAIEPITAITDVANGTAFESLTLPTTAVAKTVAGGDATDSDKLVEIKINWNTDENKAAYAAVATEGGTATLNGELSITNVAYDLAENLKATISVTVAGAVADIVYGDVDGDSEILLSDVTEAYNLFMLEEDYSPAEGMTYAEAKRCADVNQDGEVLLDDVTQIYNKFMLEEDYEYELAE